ncbi:hypothetical protein [Mangrovimonas sp. TPBH4]|uniref:hypothetical protein n=1 Tax=Mangrovimonas sp. TPBH4 TaxID=1645914 RepID=UPI0006B5B60C|nr:hypothetical protein [Mangrovimonas sp. TPBH4]
MKQLVAAFSIVVAILLLIACSGDNSSKNAIIGEWKLTYWSADVSMDLNNDGLENVNLLRETACTNNEILSFDSNGIVSSENTFNPYVIISEFNNAAAYSVNVECAEGIIGFATDYLYDNVNENVQIGESTTATIDEGELTIVYEDAIEIYNTELTEVVATKDLTKVYTKQ